jgi:hypothetical protein
MTKHTATRPRNKSARPHSPGFQRSRAELKRIYEIGQQINDALSNRHNSEERRTVTALTRTYGVSINKAYKARALAEQYSPSEFKKVCNLDLSQEWLSWSHIRQFLSIPDEKQTLHGPVQQQAAEHRCSGSWK